jgi:SWI/SNF-related matrix-associated actin-dependent regulator of chromatin subfamily A-like protein 1
VWQDEIFRWLDFIPKSAVQIIHSLNDKIDYKASFTIVSYTLACKMGELIRRMKFQIVIADEAHYLKSRDSQRSKMLVPILRWFKRVLLLTGTPLLGRPAELFNLLKILRPDLFPGFTEFGIRYTSPKQSIYGIDWSGSANTRELHLILEKSLMIRRLKSEVLSELPAKRRQKVTLPIERKSVTAIQNLL